MPYTVLSRFRHLRCLLVAACFCVSVTAFSQHTPSGVADSGIVPEARIPFLVNKVEAYTFTIDRNVFFLRRNFNLGSIEQALPDIERRLKGFKQRFEQHGTGMNLRSINSSVILLREISDDLTAHKNILTRYSEQLTRSNAEVRKIIADPELNLQVPDSTLNEQIEDVRSEGIELDTLQKRTLSKVNLLRNRISVSLLQANDISSDMVYLSISKKISMWGREDAPLLQAVPARYPQSLGAITAKALRRSGRIIMIYLSGKLKMLSLSLVLFIFITTWCLVNMRRVRKSADAAAVLGQIRFLKRSVLVGCLMGYFTYAPLLFANPTMSLLHGFEILRLATLTYLLFPFLTRASKGIWILLCILWVGYALDDILLDAAFGERWGLFVAGILLMILCIRIIRSRERIFTGIEESPATKALVIFTLAQVVLSLVFNLTGRLSLAKIAGVSAIQCLMLGIVLKVFCTMVLEAVYMQTEAYRESRFSDFINYKSLRDRFQRNLWILAVIVWIVALIRNLTLYDWMLKVAGEFFSQARSIGSYNFTFASVAIFICIIWLSSLISRFISFFFGHERAVAGGQRSSVNSMMLLIRLSIWTAGFLIAVAAAGIPIDRLSIMLGALGVGIGFGLQNIVNNLVSGIILAFERPIQIGDQIELGGKKGTVKEIGVRSSKIHLSEGADMIVPNGDMLSQHLINWTMQDRRRRVEFTIGVPYETDLETATTLISDKLKANTHILQTPGPVIIAHEFGEYAISIRIMFWVGDVATAGTVRSSAMIDTQKVLSAAGIRLQVRPLS